MSDIATTKETTPTFISRNPDNGLLEVRNLITGDLIAVQQSMDENILYAKERRAQVVLVNGREMLVEPGVPLNEVQTTVNGNLKKRTQWVYTPLVGEIFCQALVEGTPIMKLCKTQGFPPYNVIVRWRKENSSFAKMLDDAYKARSEFHRDRVLELIEEDPLLRDLEGQPIITPHGEVVTKDIGFLNLQVNGHKWLAGTDHAEKYGNKTKIEGDIAVKHSVFMVDTGIRRPGDPGYQKDQVKIIQEQESKRLEEQNGSIRGEAKKID